jgi:TRAP-type C4-dicarboxylate transport system permease small subunit
MVVREESHVIEQRFGAFLKRVEGIERGIAFIAFVLLIAVIFGDVASRELTGTGLHWARQAGVYANLFVVMFGIGIASADGAHLRARFADRWLPARWDDALSRIQHGLMALFCLGFAWLATQVVFESIALGERSVVLRIVVWPFQAVIPIVFALAVLRHGLYAVYPGLRPAEASPVSGEPANEALSSGRIDH